MAEYIEREALLSHQYNKSWSREPQFAEMVVDVENIYDAPAADVVEVVRCGQCEYYQDNNGGYQHPECRWIPDETPDADDFCSYGRRIGVVDDNSDT